MNTTLLIVASGLFLKVAEIEIPNQDIIVESKN